MERGDFAYAPCYCEENVWHLSREPDLPPGRRLVVFISNHQRSVALWAQRASPEPRSPALWDYHVLMMVEGQDDVLVLDLDTVAGFPLPLERYLDATFPFGERVEPRFRPLFRVVEAGAWRQYFASDRSHMRRGDGWTEPPPPWPPIQAPGQTMNLFELVDMDSAGLGSVFDLTSFRAHFGV